MTSQAPLYTGVVYNVHYASRAAVGTRKHKTVWAARRSHRAGGMEQNSSRSDKGSRSMRRSSSPSVGEAGRGSRSAPDKGNPTVDDNMGSILAGDDMLFPVFAAGGRHNC